MPSMVDLFAKSGVGYSDMSYTGSCCAPPKLYTFEIEDDYKLCVRRHIMEIPGKNVDNVEVEEKWINRDKVLLLKVTIKDGDDIRHHDAINVDTDVYDRYHVEVKDGLLTITLYEIINEKPKFERV